MILAHAGRRQSGLKALAKKVNKNTRILNNRERDHVITDLTTPLTTTTDIINLCAIGQGDETNERVGRKVHIESISIRGTVFKNAASIFSRIRFVVVRDNLGSTTAPVAGDLFGSVSDMFDNKHQLVNEQALKRFTILWDKFIILNENFDGQVTCKAINFKKKLNHNMLFTGAASTDEGKNSIWMFSISDEASNTPVVNADCRITYSDL